MTHTQNFALDPQQLQKNVFFPPNLGLHAPLRALQLLIIVRKSWWYGVHDHDDLVNDHGCEENNFHHPVLCPTPALILKIKCFKLKSYSCFVWQKIAIPRFPGGKNLNSLPRIFCPTISSERMGLNLHFNQILNYLRWTFVISGTKISRWLKF